MIARNALVRSTRRTPAITSVRHFRKNAPTQLTENKQVSGLAGVLEADNATFTHKVYHLSSLGLFALLPAAFVLSPSPLSVPVDLALGVLIPVHSHIGVNNVISDYVPKPHQPLARLAALGVTGVLFLGLLRANVEGEGITETVKTIWRENPNKKKQA
ncbi:hypothetical protein Poli38472_013476 [Pythium oligandrum]|uniref:Succinate dehydrogenase [ubiquinone] cytochrome b small subunit n=1 Tax=Pythium oligandrum TaxID=41045 RepID=A0A8K1C8N9_PYTOL|nr:hypothetical protein Poli38472_013476 [Pythium oligandrum]|eukprot:TMW58002.1 hypothetical protein Poli38472_013476 [Pythium oligandrum]